MIDAILFDLDGTLVNSMPLHFRAYRDTFAKFGIELTEEQYYSNIGGKASETIPKFLNGRACSVSATILHEKKKRRFIELIENGIDVLEFAKFLPVLYGKYKMAIVSAGAKIQVNAIIDKLNWRHYFDVILTGDDVARGKPDPEMFLMASRLLHIAPGSCLVVEDAAQGIEAAKAAEMQYFCIRNTIDITL